MLTDKELQSLYDKCKSVKSSWDSYYYMIFAYTQPERNTIWRLNDKLPSGLKQINLYTSAGKNGANIFVARMQKQLTPIGKNYFDFVPKDSVDDENSEELRDFLKLITERVNQKKNELKLDELFINVYFDLIAGTSIIMREDTINGIKFKCLPIYSYMLDTARNQTVIRDFKIPVWRIGIMFPELFGMTINGLSPKNPNERNKELYLKDILYFNEETEKYEYYVMFENKRLLTRIYDKSPYHIFHWTRASDMPFGAGVGEQALPDLKRLNNFVKIKLETLPFKIPMFITEEGNILDNNIEFTPGGFLSVQDVQKVQPLPLSNADQNFDVDIDREEVSIKKTMLDYTLPDDPRRMTAAEVYARSNPQDEMVALNTIRLTDTLKEIGWDIFEYIYTTELINDIQIPLKQIREMVQCNLKNQSELDTETIQKITSYISLLGQIDPQAIWQSIDRTQTLIELAKAHNLPNNVRKTASEIDRTIEEQQAAMQQAEQQAVQNQMFLDSNKENARAGRELALQQQANMQ